MLILKKRVVKPLPHKGDPEFRALADAVHAAVQPYGWEEKEERAGSVTIEAGKGSPMEGKAAFKLVFLGKDPKADHPKVCAGIRREILESAVDPDVTKLPWKTSFQVTGLHSAEFVDIPLPVGDNVAVTAKVAKLLKNVVGKPEDHREFDEAFDKLPG
ncbi:MAG: hypothetical protein ACLQU5_37465 [Isosphaeraceae bacterium]